MDVLWCLLLSTQILWHEGVSPTTGGERGIVRDAKRAGEYLAPLLRE